MAPQSRIYSLDTARGLAIVLMFLSHSVRALLWRSQIPDFGMIPIHTLTKFSSTLFFTVFGMSLAMFYLPKTGDADWKKRRWKLVKKGIFIIVVYKILTLVQLSHADKATWIAALQFDFWPDFVEVLSFYGFALLWIPFILPFWKKLPFVFKFAIALFLFEFGNYLNGSWDFFGWDTVKTILVEYPERYTFGQFQRGGIALFGVTLGEIWYHSRNRRGLETAYMHLLAFFGMGLFYCFYAMNHGNLLAALNRVTGNVGKHPPSYEFMAYSMGGSLIIFSLITQNYEFLYRKLKPLIAGFNLLGQRSLFAFSYHIVAIFLFLRNYMGLQGNISYLEAWFWFLMITLSCVIICFGLKKMEGKWPWSKKPLLQPQE